MPPPHEREANHGVLAYLGDGLEPAQVPVVVPGPDVDSRHLGAHPDVVERLWAQLASAGAGVIPVLAGHTAALLDERSGLIVAVALGTEYAIRIGDSYRQAAVEAGFTSVHTFGTVGRTLDLAATFGPGWVFGKHDAREGAWLPVCGA